MYRSSSINFFFHTQAIHFSCSDSFIYCGPKTSATTNHSGMLPKALYVCTDCMLLDLLSEKGVSGEPIPLKADE